MIREILSLLLFLVTISGLTQTVNFNQTYDFSAVEVGGWVIETNDGFLVMTNFSTAQSYRPALIALDALGNVIWQNEPNILEPEEFIISGNTLEKLSENRFSIAGWVRDTSNIAHPFLSLVDASGDSIHFDSLMIHGSLIDVLGLGKNIIAVGQEHITGSDQAFLLCMYDTNGSFLWKKNYGSMSLDEVAYSIVQCPDGGYILSGYRYDGSWDSNPYIVKTDSLGNFEWDREFELTEWGEQAAHVQIDLDGNIYVFASKVSSKGTAWEYKRTWFTKLKASGETIWEKTLSNVSITNSTYQVKIRRNKNFLVLVQSQPDNDSLGRIIGRIYEIDTSGSVLNNIDFEYDSIANPSGPNYPRSIDTTSDNGFIVAGFVSGDIPQDLWVVKFDSNGCYDSSFVDCVTGVQSVSNQLFEFKIYPNPANDIFTIYSVYASGSLFRMRIFNTAGQLVLDGSFRGPTTDVQVNDLATGVYHLEVRSEGRNKAWRTKLVVK